jgi:hypothetical protein
VEAPASTATEGFIWQAYHPLPRFDGNYTVIGSWIVGEESAGIGIREDDRPSREFQPLRSPLFRYEHRREAPSHETGIRFVRRVRRFPRLSRRVAVLLALFIAIYIRMTPYREMALIREGNMAASFSLSGSILGFVVPLSAPCSTA